MGTNYYAHWNPNGGGGGPARILYPQPVLVLHVCKSYTNFQGQVFNSWAAWQHFLYANEWELEIVDEYGSKHKVTDFISAVEGTSREERRRQFDWVQRYRTVEPNRDWLDADGFSFYSGEFS